MADNDGKPLEIPVGEEITVKVDTGALARHDQIASLARDLRRLAGRVARVEQLALQAIRRTNPPTKPPKN